MNSSPLLNELAAALAKAQAKIKGAVKDSDNPFFKSKYADLDAVWDVAREPLTSNGLSVVQFPGSDGDKVTLETVLLHSSGQWMTAPPLSVKPMKQDPQGVGSAVTYMRRYSLAAVAGITQVDDDGNTATKGRPAPADDNDRGNNDNGGSIPFDPKNEDHKKWLRKELTARKVTGQLAFDALAAMAGKFEEDLDGVLQALRK
ncbi:MAG: ERF family protein [Pseudomonadota bacterium]